MHPFLLSLIALGSWTILGSFARAELALHPAERTPPPAAFADSARAHLARHVGAAFVARHLTMAPNPPSYLPVAAAEPPPGLSRGMPVIEPAPPKRPGWMYQFRFRMPERPWIDELVTVTVDLDGRLIPGAGGDALLGSGVEGIGPCARDTVQCFFPIDREEAVAIARTEGLEQGLAAWKIDFSWRRPEGRFMWSLENTLRDEGACNQAGRIVFIDANTGQILKKHAWIVTCSH